MKNILIVAATYHELHFLEKYNLKPVDDLKNHFQFVLDGIAVDVLITGVGMIATTFNMTKHLSSYQYDFILNIGIAGAFDRTIDLGTIVQITDDCFVEMGADSGEQFISIFEMGFVEKNEFPFQDGLLKNNTDLSCLSAVKKIKSSTVNKVSGNPESIDKLTAYLTSINYVAQTESMEGAAFFYVCLQFKTPCMQVRAISNYIEKRNKAAWKIKEALENLEPVVINMLNELAAINN